jgi:hypothetical protein
MTTVNPPAGVLRLSPRHGGSAGPDGGVGVVLCRSGKIMAAGRQNTTKRHVAGIRIDLAVPGNSAAHARTRARHIFGS